MTSRRLAILGLVALALVVARAAPAAACTNFIVTRGASADNSTMLSYTADSHELYGELYFWPAGQHVAGTPLPVKEWDTGDDLGTIPQVATTYSVVGNMNEFQLSIGETTFGGRKELADPKGKIDYGSLIYVALQRAKTAREAIGVMTGLAAQFGYKSEGESFSLTDPKEAWILEMTGKGPGGKGALWVARKIPDGYISAHANQARIRQFPLHDPETTIYSPDVIQFARDKKWFSGKDEDFSFAETYAPLTYGALRFCEARVWSLFRRAAPSLNLTSDYVKGVAGAKPLPLWIKPDKPLSARDVMALMRDHFEGTEFDLTNGVGAGPYNLPYRWRPLTWEVGKTKYVNDRAISTQQTGFSFVAQSRADLPDPIGGLFWFGVDDTASTVWVPIYCGVRRAPHSFAVGTGDFHHFTWDSAFWAFNVVSNFAYSRYSDVIKDVQVVQRELEGSFFGRQQAIEQAALEIYRRSPEQARDYLTDYSTREADAVVARWRALFEQLFVKYLDGNVRDAHGKITHPAYSEEWRKRMAAEDGKKLEYHKLPGEPDDAE